MRGFFLIVGGVIYLIFFATFLYLIGFVANAPFLPRTVDNGPDAPIAAAIAVDVVLIALFGLQHSVMARQGFKRVWTKIVPHVLERSVFVLVSSLLLILLFAGWRPIPATVWIVPTFLAPVLWLLCALGWGLVLLSTFLINHFELFGLQQVWLHLRQRSAASPSFYQPFLYRIIRHPLYLGFIIASWATPVMSAGQLLLAIGMTAYILIAIRYEVRDLVGLFGADYEAYQRRVGTLVPGIGKRA